MSGFSLDGVTLLFPTVGTRRSQGIRGLQGGGCGVSASHLAHLIVLSGLTVVPLGLRLPLGLSPGLPLAAVTAVGVGVLGLVLHLRAGVLLRSSPLQSAWQWFGRWQLWVTAWCMNAADLNETSHEHDEGDAHQQHSPPVSHNPLCNVLVEFWVKDGLL